MKGVSKLSKSDMESEKNAFLDTLSQKAKEVEKWQREYLGAATTKIHSRNAAIMQNSYMNTRTNLLREKNNLKAQIWVAAGKTHTVNSTANIYEIKCHLNCQERLSTENQRLKSSIASLNHQINNCNKAIYDLNRSLAKIQKKKVIKWLTILEDQLETLVHQECSFCADNELLREDLVAQLNDRRQFNYDYTKLMHRLTSEKKYLMELIDFALGKFENCIEIFEKTEILTKRNAKEVEFRKIEMEGIVRDVVSKEERNSSHIIKLKERSLVDLQPKEYKRRALGRKNCERKMAVYEEVLEKILNYTRCRNVDRVIEKFQQQESLYYSYFNYANEMSYHMTLLNNSVNRLYTDINGLKLMNRNNYQHQMEMINHLIATLAQKKKRNKHLGEVLQDHDKRIRKLFEGMQLIRDETCTLMPHSSSLIDFLTMTKRNMRIPLKLIEKRISSIVAVTYVSERMNSALSRRDYVVRDIEKICDWPTALDAIVMTQQCPECAESDDFMDDSETCAILSMQAIKKKLYDKVVQPEMQYRLHSISQCRLPRARLLISRRNS